MALSYTNLAFQLGSALATNHLTDSQFVKGTYVVVKDAAEKGLLPVDDMGDDGVITPGSLVFVQSEGKTYRYAGKGSWVEQSNADGRYVPQIDALPSNLTDIVGVTFQYIGAQVKDGDNVIANTNYFYKAEDDGSGKVVLKPLQVQRGMATANEPTSDEEKRRIDRLEILTIDGTKYKTGGDYVPQVKTLPVEADIELGYICEYVGEDTHNTEFNIDLYNAYFYKFVEVEDPDTGVKRKTWIVVQTQNEVVANSVDDPDPTQLTALQTVKIDDKDYYIAGDVTYVAPRKTTVAVGGIAKGKDLAKDYSIEDLRDLITQMLCPYVAPTTLAIKADPAFGTYEYGTSITFNKFTGTWTGGSEAITNLTINCADGDVVNETNVTGLSSNTAYNTAITKTLDGTTDYAFTASATDGTTTLSASSTGYKFAKYVYYKVVSDPTTPPTSGTKGNDTNISYTAGSYIYFLCPEQYAQIQQYATGQWNKVDTIAAGTVEFKLASGATVTYYAYRTPELGITDTGRFQIIK